MPSELRTQNFIDHNKSNKFDSYNLISEEISRNKIQFPSTANIHHQ